MFLKYDGLAAKIYKKVGYVLVRPLLCCGRHNKKGEAKAAPFCSLSDFSLIQH
jgi:hypothetical protein